MKLRLDEYYYIISYNWDNIENYMPENMADELDKFRESYNQAEIFDYLENLYSYIKVINSEYNINDIDLGKSLINYTAIIKIGDKYYSFDWYFTLQWRFEDRVDVDKDLVEVTPKEITTIIYE